jgi:NitT/TauT family transport system substrate-binding protein
MKRLFFVAVSIGLILSGAAYGQEKKLEPLFIAETSAAAPRPQKWIAKELGLYEKYGLNVTIVTIGGSATALQALLGGDIQFFFGTGAAAVAAALRGAPVAIVATSGPTPFNIVSHPSITSIQELKGKTLGISGFGGSDYFLVRRLLPRIGLTPGKDVTILPIGLTHPLQKVPLIFQGKIDATVASPDSVREFDLKGVKLNVLAEAIPNGVFATAGDLITTRNFVAKSRQRAKAFLMATIEAVAHAKKDRDLVLRTYQKFLRSVDLRVFDPWYKDTVLGIIPQKPYPLEASIHATLEDLSLANPDILKGKSLKVADFVDTTILDELEKEGFFTNLPR